APGENVARNLFPGRRKDAEHWVEKWRRRAGGFQFQRDVGGFVDSEANAMHLRPFGERAFHRRRELQYVRVGSRTVDLNSWVFARLASTLRQLRQTRGIQPAGPTAFVRTRAVFPTGRQAAGRNPQRIAVVGSALSRKRFDAQKVLSGLFKPMDE